MNILNKIKSIEFDKNRSQLFGIKSGILWGHSNEENSIFPLLYISKPKHLSQGDYELLLERLEISIKYNESDFSK